jgi:hypothetical protein
LNCSKYRFRKTMIRHKTDRNVTLKQRMWVKLY